MTHTAIPPDHAHAAFADLAPFYDAFTAHHDYELWTQGLEGLARRHGLAGARLLDLACGTGKSFLPFLDRGYSVVACDVSAAMLDVAAAKVGHRAELLQADIRDEPALGEFDLVTCLDDVANYLLHPDELAALVRAARANLAPAGLFLFDANALWTYATFFATNEVCEAEGLLLLWQGRCSTDPESGTLAEATLDIFTDEGGAGWAHSRTSHFQRHHSQKTVERAITRAGLECVGIYGQFPDVTFHQPVDERRHNKAIYLARRAL